MAVILAVYACVPANSKPAEKRSHVAQIIAADAGSNQYVTGGPVVLDGTGSYGPEGCAELKYAWEKVLGPWLAIDDPNSATPSISGFVQTGSLQRCRFRLTVSCGELVSNPDTVDVVIVPDFGPSTLNLENESFDPDKPTLICFGGGNSCSDGQAYRLTDPEWLNLANIIDFPSGYLPDSGSSPRTFYHYGDMIIVYLSEVAKDYRRPIQSFGFSAGGQPALDVGIRLNQTYGDARYALNVASLIDPGYCLETRGNPTDYIDQFLGSSVDGEQCRIDHYIGVNKQRYPNVLNMESDMGHVETFDWYLNSLANPDMNVFNGGVVAGTYWSVFGPGRNLQLASTPETYTYFFRWRGSSSSGYMDFYNEALYPARLPEPFELSEAAYSEDDRDYLLTCEESENAVVYELLVGSDPYRVMDYEVAWAGPAPPNEPVRPLFFERKWWTVLARDQYGSTIHADPDSIKPKLKILDLYRDGQMNFKDFAVLGQHWSESESSCDLGPGLFGDGHVDIRDVAAISNYWLADLRAAAHWKLDEEEGKIAHDSIGGNHGTVHGGANWRPSGGESGGALEMDGTDDYVSTGFVLNPADGPFSVFAWVKAGSVEGVVISQTDSGENNSNWLATDSSGNLMTNIKRPGRLGWWPLISQANITDGNWHRVGLVCDGDYRRLYADGAEVAADSVAVAGIIAADGGLHIGADSALSPASFWTGLIDDVCIYDQAVTP